MLVIQRCTSILPTIENDHVSVSQGRQRKPSSIEIVKFQKIVLRLKLNRVQDHLRPDGAVFVQNQLMPRTEHSKREVLAVACECWRSLLASGGPGFSGQAVSHVELELVCVSSTFAVHELVQIDTSKGLAET